MRRIDDQLSLLLAFSQRLFGPHALVDLALGGPAQLPLLVEHGEHPQRDRKHAREAAEEVSLLGTKALASRASEDEGPV